jgi:hypothetical protein
MSLQRLVRCLFVFVLFVSPAFAQVTKLGPLIPENLGSSTAVQQAKVSDLLYSAGRLTAAERHELGSLSGSERQRLTAPEPGGNRALKVGIERQLPSRIGFDALDPEAGAGKGIHVGGGLLENTGAVVVWTTAIRSADAGAIRLQLAGSLPPSARAYIYAGTGEVHGPYTQTQLMEGSFWTNTVYADEVFLEVQIMNPAEAKLSSLTVRSMVHIESPQFAPSLGKGVETNGTECFIDVTCVPDSEFANLVTTGRAMAQLIFVNGGSAFVCSGGLLNNTRQDASPLFLTANHCFDSQTAASTLEATWNYKTTSCSDLNTEPNRALFPRSLGATLLATGAATDFTLVRLNQPPPNTATFLGWTTQDIATAGGTKLFRVHHPQGQTQFYARHSVVATGNTCSSLPRGNYIYMLDEVSGAAGGSSGSPVMLADGSVVGQLRGACGPNVSDDCDRANRTVDGAFRNSFAALEQFLAPTSTPSQCTPNATTACVLNNRFKVTVKFRGAFDNQPANTNANVKQVTGFANPAFETAFFFFNDPNNIEMLIKVLDQGNTNAQGQRTIAILFGSATPLRLEIEVTDTTNGAVKRYTSEFGQMRGTTDFNAFIR